MIPYGRQDIDAADIDAVVAVLRSDWITQGPVIAEFEAAFASRCQAAHAVAVNSATSALHIGCLALGIGPGSLVWTTPNTFLASANCARLCGADVDFVDLDERTYNLCAQRLEEKLCHARARGRLPDLVIPVHFAGQSPDMRRIHELAQEFHFKIMEDASHAVGADYLGAPVGNCRYSDLCVFSFHPVKIVTTGEGGMLTCKDPAVARHLARLRSHGMTRDPLEMQADSPGAWYYEQIELGLNYRITDIQAALGLSQLRRLDQFVARRRELAARYRFLLAELPVTVPFQSPDSNSAWHLYVIQLGPARAAASRREVFVHMRAAGIGVNVHYIPVHTQPYYAALGFKPEDFPASLRYYGNALTLPLYPLLTDAEQDQVVAALATALDSA